MRITLNNPAYAILVIDFCLRNKIYYSCENHPNNTNGSIQNDVTIIFKDDDLETIIINFINSDNLIIKEVAKLMVKELIADKGDKKC